MSSKWRERLTDAFSFRLAWWYALVFLGSSLALVAALIGTASLAPPLLLLVAPILEEGAVGKAVYLPKGTWYSFWTDTPYEGGRWLLLIPQL